MNSKDKVKNKKKKRNYLLLQIVKFLGLPLMLWMRPKIFSIGNTRPKDVKKGAILACNHTSMNDVVFCYGVFWHRIIHSVATTDLYKNKFITFFLNQGQCIPVNRDNFSMRCFHEVKELLLKEKLVLIFPEGKINTKKEEEDMLPFKSGVILMAHSTGKPIIPMYIVKGKKWYNRWYGVLGDPVDVRGICGPIPSLDKVNQVSVLLREKETELKEFYERSRKK